MSRTLAKIISLVASSLLVALVSGFIFLSVLNYGPCGLAGVDQGAGGGAPAGMMAVAVTVVAAIVLLAIVMLVETAKALGAIKGDIPSKFWLSMFAAAIVCAFAFASWFLYIACK